MAKGPSQTCGHKLLSHYSLDIKIHWIKPILVFPCYLHVVFIDSCDCACDKPDQEANILKQIIPYFVIGSIIVIILYV